MRPEKAFLFAAGLGTRMAPLTKTRPKPLIDVAGKPLLDHAISALDRRATPNLIANTHYMAPMLSRALAERGVRESYEATLLDTGGGLKHALRDMADPSILTLNTDAVWTGRPATTLLEAWDCQKMDALLLLAPRDEALGHTLGGDFDIEQSGTLRRGDGYVYTGMQIIKREPVIEERESVFGMMQVWQKLMQKGAAFGVVHQGGWCDVGHPGGIKLAEAMLAADHV
ncbi:MAG: nucleotidyltransferase family protein [Pseudomonadota bacterium]